MLLTKNQIKNAALKLDPSDREALAEELLLSIEGTEQDEIDAAWLAEVRRRDSDFIVGKSRAKSVDQVVRRLKRKSAR